MHEKPHLRQKQAFFLCLLLLALTFVAFFPLSIRIADPLLDRPFKPNRQRFVLFLWPDHIEIHPLELTGGIMRRPENAPYNFLIPQDRLKWVKQQLRQMPTPRPGSAWNLRISQHDQNHQQVQLDLVRDGIVGLRYLASKDEIVPLYSRLNGPLGSLDILAVHIVIWGGTWLLLWVGFRLTRANFSGAK